MLGGHSGIYNQRSHEKHLPAPVFQLSNNQVALLLRHLWATDGTVFIGKNIKNPSPRLAFSTNSERLANEVALLLLRFGIVARIGTVQQGQYRPMYPGRYFGKRQSTAIFRARGDIWRKRKYRAGHQAIPSPTHQQHQYGHHPHRNIRPGKSKMREKGISQRKMASMRETAYGGGPTSNFRLQETPSPGMPTCWKTGS